jgi:hypothetical protein
MQWIHRVMQEHKYSYEVIAGAEILEIPEAALPEGAIP